FALLGSYPPIYNGWTTGTVNLISIALNRHRLLKIPSARCTPLSTITRIALGDAIRAQRASVALQA
ncbi:MAG: hypothetical protein VB142_10770, partial [Burkholderia sp.]